MKKDARKKFEKGYKSIPYNQTASDNILKCNF